MHAADDLANRLAIIQTFLAALLVILTLLYVLTTRRQLAAMKAALEETRRSNEATKKSNEIAERNLELGRRAWLIVSGIETRAYPARPGVSRFGVVVTVKNVGGVPAAELATLFRIGVVTDDVTLPDCAQKFDSTLELEPDTLGPGESLSVVEPMPEVSEEDEARIRAKEAFLMVYCEVGYTDIFERPRKSTAGWERSIGPGDNWVHVPRYNRME